MRPFDRIMLALFFLCTTVSSVMIAMIGSSMIVLLSSHTHNALLSDVLHQRQLRVNTGRAHSYTNLYSDAQPKTLNCHLFHSALTDTCSCDAAGV